MTFLANEAVAYKVLKEELLKAYPDLEDDAETLADTLEGETSFLEAVTHALDKHQDALDLIEGIKARVADLAARRSRLQDQANKIKSAILAAMEEVGEQKITLPEYTLSAKKLPPKLVITEEFSLPGRFFVPQESKLDKKAVTDALKSGEEIPGAILSNGGQALQIRSK